VDADSVTLFLTEGQLQVRHGGTYPSHNGEEAPPVGESLSLSKNPLMKKVVDSGQALAIETDDPSLQPSMRMALKETGVVAKAFVPLKGRDQVLGLISVSLRQPGRKFSEHDCALLQTLSDQAMNAIQRVRLLEETQRKARHEQILREITARVSRSADVDTVMRTAVEEIGRALGRRAFVYLKNENKPVSPEVKNGA
jgi:GAF domain-containing protein